jgi:hypothetical protein
MSDKNIIAIYSILLIISAVLVGFSMGINSGLGRDSTFLNGFFLTNVSFYLGIGILIFLLSIAFLGKKYNTILKKLK